MSFRLHDAVRVVRLSRADRPHDFISPVQPPAVGDLGTIVDIPDENDLLCPVLVEAVADDGHTLWLAEFDRTELELVE